MTLWQILVSQKIENEENMQNRTRVYFFKNFLFVDRAVENNHVFQTKIINLKPNRLPIYAIRRNLVPICVFTYRQHLSWPRVVSGGRQIQDSVSCVGLLCRVKFSTFTAVTFLSSRSTDCKCTDPDLTQAAYATDLTSDGHITCAHTFWIMHKIAD